MIKKILIISCLFLTAPAMADETSDRAEFKRLYAEFNELYANSEELDPVIEVAEKLYELAPGIYGKKHMNTANVTYNLASLYLEKAKKINDRDMYEKTAGLMDQYFELLDDLEAPQDKNYVYQYMEYIDAMSSIGQKKSLRSHTSKVRRIAKSLDYDTATRGDIEFTLGYQLFVDNEHIASLDYFEKANEYFTDAYGPDHYKTGESAFWAAKIQMAQKKRRTAERYFLSALDAFEKSDKKSSDIGQSTHAFLVALYEDMGESNKATLHCRAVAEERPKGFDRHITPLYRKNPVFPTLSPSQWGQVKKDSVEVLLEFDVDENGFTQNVRVIESENEKFNKNSVEAAEGYRYAPRIENGEIVATQGARLQISYRVAR